MSDRAAWFCPSCQKHHAPHCDTCPGPVVASGAPNGYRDFLPNPSVFPHPNTAADTPWPPVATVTVFDNPDVTVWS